MSPQPYEPQLKVNLHTMSAYNSFDISERGLSLIIHNTIKDRAERQLDTFSASPPSQQEVKRLFKRGLEQLKEQLNVSDLRSELVAVKSTPEQLEWCRECAEGFGLEPHQILEPSIAYASAFFEPVRDTVIQEMDAWLDLIEDKPYLLEHTEVDRSDLQDAREALLHQVMRVAVVGAMKAGKSTFLNALLGRYIMPAMDKRCTRRQFTLRNANDQGEQRRLVEVLTLSADRTLTRSEVLSLDIDRLNWSDDDLRAYLFALNSPDLFSAPEDTLDKMELQLKRDFESISFGNTRVQNSIRQSLKSESHLISKIILTHPLYALTPETTGQMEFWDTPGPNAIETEIREAQDQGEAVVQRERSDRETYKNALRRADALLVIFDVMQQEAESQDEIFRTVKERQGASGSVLLIANKVDQRQSRDTIPLDDVLAGIQRDAYERYDGMRLRKPIPNASKPAQLAREVARALEEHPDCLNIDELLDSHPHYEPLIDDYEKTEDRRARKFSRDKPWHGVEEYSGIKGTEQALGAFFKQETGRAVLGNCVYTLHQFLTKNQEYTSRQLAGLRAEMSVLVNVREDLERGQTHLSELQRDHRDRFKSIEDGIKREIEGTAKAYEDKVINELNNTLTDLYGSTQKNVHKLEYQKNTARHKRDIDRMVRAQITVMEETTKRSEEFSQILVKLLLFYGALSTLILYHFLDHHSAPHIFEYALIVLTLAFIYPYYTLMRQRLNDRGHPQLIGWIFLTPLFIITILLISALLNEGYYDGQIYYYLWIIGTIIGFWSFIETLIIGGQGIKVDHPASVSAEPLDQITLEGPPPHQMSEPLLRSRLTNRTTVGLVVGAIQVVLINLFITVDYSLLISVIIGGLSMVIIFTSGPSRMNLKGLLLTMNLCSLIVAVRFSGSLFDYHRYWAGDLYRRGQYVESAERYVKANLVRPIGQARHHKLGQVYLRLNQRERALQAFQEAVYRQPTNQKAQRSLQRLLSEGNH
jgi:GTPase Era involved in 16S rRNA processing/uncharacterized membrane protein YhaH (DUF805 family)